MTIEIYTTPQCGFCRQIKALLKEHHLTYEEHDVTASDEALREMQTLTNGAMSVPVVVVDKGKSSQGIAVGFDDARKILRLGQSAGANSEDRGALANLTCPKCGHKQKAPIPTASCVPFYLCDGCKQVVQAAGDDCCVFCSYADRPCPLKAKDGACEGGVCALRSPHSQ